MYISRSSVRVPTLYEELNSPTFPDQTNSPTFQVTGNLFVEIKKLEPDFGTGSHPLGPGNDR